MNSLRGNTKVRSLSRKTQMQIVDFHQADNGDREYEVIAFGINKQEESICCRITGFRPFFYVRIPDNVQVADFKESLERLVVEKRYRNGHQFKRTISSFAEIYYEEKKVFNMYQGKETKFLKLLFISLADHNKVKWVIRNDNHTIQVNGEICKLELCEDNLEPYIRFCHLKDINMSGHISIKNFAYTRVHKISRCQHEIRCSVNNVEAVESAEIHKLLIASFDIETFSSVDNTFPKAQRKDDKIIQIGTTVTKYGDPDYSLKYIATLGECDDIEGAIVERCGDEKDLLIKWFKFIGKLDPDIITGYNTFGFDYEYIFERGLLHHVAHQAIHLNRLLNLEGASKVQKLYTNYETMFYKNLPKRGKQRGSIRSVYRTEETSSKGTGDNQMSFIMTTGRANIDLLKYCRENGDKLTSYKLDAVATHHGLQGKDNMPYKEIFRIYRKGTSAEKKQVAEYCIQDCFICNKLVDKINLVPNYIGMSNVCSVPSSYLFIRGQSIRLHSLLQKECTDAGFVVLGRQFRKQFVGVTGANVLEPEVGNHESPISVLDFASLYPSCMISHNICISTKLTDENIRRMNLSPADYRTIKWTDEIKPIQILDKLLNNNVFNEMKNRYAGFVYMCGGDNEGIYTNKTRKGCLDKVEKFVKERYDRVDRRFFHILGIDYNDIALGVDYTTKDKREKRILLIQHKHHYYQKEQGLIPRVLSKLLRKRNETKKLKKQFAVTNKSLSSIYDGLQLSYKITANAAYGQLGAKFSNFSFPAVAATVTATGREFLSMSQKFVEKHYHGAKTIYGDTDSLFVKFQVKKHDKNCICHSSKITDHKLEFLMRIRESAAILQATGAPFDCSYEWEAITKQCPFILRPRCSCPVMKRKNKERLLRGSMKMAREVEEIFTQLLPNNKIDNVDGVHKFEYEKTYYPFLIFSKKRYTGKCFGNDVNNFKLDSKGIVLQRRDNCGLLRRIYKDCMDDIIHKSAAEGIKRLRNSLEEMKNGKVPIEEYVVSQTLRAYSHYKINAKHGFVTQAQVMLAKRVEERDPGNAFQLNDRVPYCFIKKNNWTLQGERIETPEYIKDNGLKIDWQYYISNQLQTPICQLFALTGNDLKSFFKSYINYNPGSLLNRFNFKVIKHGDGGVVKQRKKQQLSHVKNDKMKNNDIMSKFVKKIATNKEKSNIFNSKKINEKTNLCMKLTNQTNIIELGNSAYANINKNKKTMKLKQMKQMKKNKKARKSKLNALLNNPFEKVKKAKKRKLSVVLKNPLDIEKGEKTKKVKKRKQKVALDNPFEKVKKAKKVKKVKKRKQSVAIDNPFEKAKKAKKSKLDALLDNPFGNAKKNKKRKRKNRLNVNNAVDDAISIAIKKAKKDKKRRRRKEKAKLVE